MPGGVCVELGGGGGRAPELEEVVGGGDEVDLGLNGVFAAATTTLTALGAELLMACWAAFYAFRVTAARTPR